MVDRVAWPCLGRGGCEFICRGSGLKLKNVVDQSTNQEREIDQSESNQFETKSNWLEIDKFI